MFIFVKKNHKMPRCFRVQAMAVNPRGKIQFLRALPRSFLRSQSRSNVAEQRADSIRMAGFYWDYCYIVDAGSLGGGKGDRDNRHASLQQSTHYTSLTPINCMTVENLELFHTK